MKILLVNPHVPLSLLYGEKLKKMGAVLPPLGIFYIASYLRNRKDTEVEILDANALNYDANTVVEYIKKNNPNLVGFSCTTTAYGYAKEIAQKIRENNPELRILAGGAHAQAAADDILADNHALFDFVCYGEGETAMESLIDHLSGKISKIHLRGWKYLENDAVVTSLPAEIPDNLDIFGHPSEIMPTSLIRHYHEKVNAYMKLPMSAIMSSRGCPFNCFFCSSPEKFKNIYGKKVRYHSTEWIIKEMEIFRSRSGVKEIIFLDDTFNLDKNRVREFCQKKKAARIAMKWSCNFEAAIADQELFHAMKKAGCWTVMLGGESGSDKILKFIHKGVTAAQLLMAGKWAARAGILTRVSFIFGLPTETEETISETIDLIHKSDFHFPYFQLYMPLPGTALYRILSQYGTISPDIEKRMTAGTVNYIPNGLSSEILQRSIKSAYRRCYLNWRMIKNHLSAIRAPSDAVRLLRGVSFFFRL